MTNPETDLLGDPIPEPLPENIQLFDIADLKGHTIRAAIDYGHGRYHADIVLVTATGCWLALEAEVDGCGDDSAEVKVVRKNWRAETITLHDYVNADTLFNEGCITASERTHLLGVEAERRKQNAADRAQRLRAEAERTEREAGLVPAQSSNGST